MIPIKNRLTHLLLMSGIAAGSFASDPPGNTNETTAIDWLQKQVEFLACNESHHVYGVGYIDGSYMERIFLVADEAGKPRVDAVFREADPTWHATESDLEPRSFTVEVKVPRALYAQKSNSGWQVSTGGWESALRFKYTSWFGLVSRVDGQWQVKWQGYRRPMLPPELLGEEKKVCSWFNVD